MKFVLYVLIAVLYILNTLFGLGPVLFADGSARERLVTFIAVVLIYAVITVCLRMLLKWRKR